MITINNIYFIFCFISTNPLPPPIPGYNYKITLLPTVSDPLPLRVCYYYYYYYYYYHHS